MLLKRLEISGFKSFVKQITLEFPMAITAIVGPNGSGKSNVADSVRWVLGEQSMKSLRGKRGEDLIFGGTPTVPRLGKALVSLVFDNRKHIFPVEFDEFVISRVVYRDGANEYMVNGTQTRLKDIIELLSHVGLGASQHHIIGQGDADRILYASPRERKSMIEEALGLKIFELKKLDAERKLKSTEENRKQVELMQRELKPHLKYLEDQAKKSQTITSLRNELDALSREYVARELFSIEEETKNLEIQKSPIILQISELARALNAGEKESGNETEAKKFFEELASFDKALRAIAEKRILSERKLWQTKQSRASFGSLSSISVSDYTLALEDLASEIRGATNLTTLEEMRVALSKTLGKIRGIIARISGKEKNTNDISEIDVISKELSLLLDEEKKIQALRVELEKNFQKRAAEADNARISYKSSTEKLAKLKDNLRTIVFEEEKLKNRENELTLDFAVFLKTENIRKEEKVFASGERDSARKKIERLRIRIEEAGGVDESIIAEYESTCGRNEMLTRELKDLEEATFHITQVLRDLEEKIAKDFERGIKEINALFGSFFHEIFGGGKAELKLFIPKQEKKISDEEGDAPQWEEIEDTEPGLEVLVDIPRKRIKSLSMLSGGERALTSIALLFAVSTVKPPPFLVLDETDAALDEANSRKYGEMLTKLSEKTQLLVITHNRETMKFAGVLYGVTMGADGVSKLLSLKLEEAEEVVTNKKVG